MTPGLTDLPDRQFSATKYSHALLFRYSLSICFYLSAQTNDTSNDSHVLPQLI